MLRLRSIALAAGSLVANTACVGGPATPAPLPVAQGALAIRVVYPPPRDTSARVSDGSVIEADSQYRIASQDSAFIFGSVGRGDAVLRVDGHAVPVFRSGAWLAWLPLPDDSVARFSIVATAGGETARAIFTAPLAWPPRPPSSATWIDTTSFVPMGDRWLRPGEGVRLSVRATPRAEVRAVLPTGDTLWLRPDSSEKPLPWGQRAFAVDPDARARPVTPGQYQGWWVGAFGPDPGHVMSPAWESLPQDSGWVTIEAISGADTARARWPLRMGIVDMAAPPLVVINDDTAGTGATDSIVPGRPTPYGTYHWFFPTGTVAAVSGRWNSQVRLQLSQASVAWVDAADVQPLAPGTPPIRGTARSLRVTPGEGAVTLRVPLPGHIPFRIDEDERSLVLRLYGVAADMDWIHYGGTDPFVRLVSFEQPAEDEVEVRVWLAEAIWGYRTRWADRDLLLEIRRPPPIDPKRPLAGRRVAIDPGHPPGGATGPTGTREPDVTLAVALKVRTLLTERGAGVVLTRSTERSVELYERPRIAEQADAEALVSIHANALPDGVNPFVNSGTSVYYFHPRSAPLARALDRALVSRLGVRNLGFGRGDLALARPTWMPAALTEGLFIMLPEHEAILASEEGQWRYARGVVEGLEAFFGMRAPGS